MVSAFQRGAHGIDSRHAGGKHVGSPAAFESRQINFQASAGGVRDASIFVSFMFADFFLNVRGCRVNRNGDCAGGWVGLLAGMNGLGGEAKFFFSSHERSGACGPTPRRLATRRWRRNYFPPSKIPLDK